MLENTIFLGTLICCNREIAQYWELCHIGYCVIKFKVTVGGLFLSDLELF